VASHSDVLELYQSNVKSINHAQSSDPIISNYLLPHVNFIPHQRRKLASPPWFRVFPLFNRELHRPDRGPDKIRFRRAGEGKVSAQTNESELTNDKDSRRSIEAYRKFGYRYSLSHASFSLPSPSHASKTVCALVPPAPNEFTPATLFVILRGPEDLLGIAIFAGSTRASGRRVVKLRFGGASPFRRTRRALIRPIIPAAPSACPNVDLTVPRTKGSVDLRAPKTRPTVSSSLRSPETVPVAWHSKNPTSSGFSPAFPNASRITEHCPSTLGAAINFPRPLCPSALPLITPAIGSPSRSARERGLRTTAPQPSPRT